MSKPITAIIVGAGHRSFIYASLAKTMPEKLKIVGVADPSPVRRKMAQDMFGFGDDMVFDSAEALFDKPKLADAIINGTMDHLHVPTSIPLLKKGYDMLLEKPFAVNEDEMWELYNTAKEYGNTVFICHVLRYAPFYEAIKQRLADGEIGQIMNIQQTEHVSYHHVMVSFIRGKWRSEAVCHATFLLAKCCHDMDVMMWLMGDDKPRRIASFGSDFQFTPDKMPAGAGKRCLVDCPAEVEKECPFSARKHYLDHPDRWSFYVWDCFDGMTPTLQDKENALKTDNIYGKCAYQCGHEGVDHQTVMVEFESGATGTLNMIGGSTVPERNIHIVGTKGEIKGTFDTSTFTVRKINQAPGHDHDEEFIDLNIGGDKSGMTGSHGGGDVRLALDFVNRLQGQAPSISCSSLEDSVSSHLAVFCAEESRRTGTVVDMSQRWKNKTK